MDAQGMPRVGGEGVGGWRQGKQPISGCSAGLHVGYQQRYVDFQCRSRWMHSECLGLRGGGGGVGPGRQQELEVSWKDRCVSMEDIFCCECVHNGL